MSYLGQPPGWRAANEYSSSSRAVVVVLTVCPTSVTIDRRGHLYSSCQVGQTCAVWRGSDRCETAVEAPARHGLRLYSIRNVRHQSTNDRPSACRAAMTRCADDPTPSRHLSQFSLSLSTISPNSHSHHQPSRAYLFASARRHSVRLWSVQLSPVASRLSSRTWTCSFPLESARQSPPSLICNLHPPSPLFSCPPSLEYNPVSF